MSEGWLKALVIACVAGVIASLATGIVSLKISKSLADDSANAAYALQHPGSVLIEGPDRNSFQNRLLEVRGTMRLPANTEAQLWIIIRSDIRGDGTYYPQGYAESDDVGRWSCVVTLGSKRTDDDGRYEVIAALASPAAARKLRDFVQNELAASPDGMTDFPADGVDIKDERPLRRDSRVASQSGIQEHTGFC